MRMLKFTRKWHDSKIIPKHFEEGSKVLLFNSRFKLFASKLKPKWSGPFTVLKVFSYGVLELKNERTNQVFRVNGHRVKLYVEAAKNPMVQQAHLVLFK